MPLELLLLLLLSLGLFSFFLRLHGQRNDHRLNNVDLLLRLSVSCAMRLATHAARVLSLVKFALLVALEARLCHQYAIASRHHGKGLGFKVGEVRRLDPHLQGWRGRIIELLIGLKFAPRMKIAFSVEMVDEGHLSRCKIMFDLLREGFCTF